MATRNESWGKSDLHVLGKNIQNIGALAIGNIGCFSKNDDNL